MEVGSDVGSTHTKMIHSSELQAAGAPRALPLGPGGVPSFRGMLLRKYLTRHGFGKTQDEYRQLASVHDALSGIAGWPRRRFADYQYPAQVRNLATSSKLKRLMMHTAGKPNFKELLCSPERDEAGEAVEVYRLLVLFALGVRVPKFIERVLGIDSSKSQTLGASVPADVAVLLCVTVPTAPAGCLLATRAHLQLGLLLL